MSNQLFLGWDVGCPGPSAWSVVRGMDEVISHGTIESKNIRDLYVRVHGQLEILGMNFRFRGAAIEDAFLGKNIRSMKTIVKAQAVIELAMMQRGVPYSLVLATGWRKGLIKSRDRDSAKAEAVAMVRHLYGITMVDHAAEATLIARWSAGQFARLNMGK